MDSEQKVIRAEAKELVRKIRQYCKDQARIWRLIPRLALEADGRSGWSDQLSRAYYYKTWALQGCGTDTNGYVALIDLQNGEIVSSYDDSKPAEDRHVLALAWDLIELDAGRLADDLKQQARVPQSKHVGKRSPKEYNELARTLKVPRRRELVPLQFG